MEVKVNRIQDIETDMTPEALNDLLNATSRSVGGNWRIIRVSERPEGGLRVQYQKEVRIPR